MQDTMTLQQGLMEDVQGLPPESLALLREFAQFLKVKARGREAGSAAARKSPASLRPVNLEGIWKDCDVSPEVLAEARREMWGEYLRGDAS